MTQLVGRLLRQPQTRFVDERFQTLNECYVFCRHAQTREFLDAIKTGLENDGVNDLAKTFATATPTSAAAPSGNSLSATKISKPFAFSSPSSTGPKARTRGGWTTSKTSCSASREIRCAQTNSPTV